MNTLLHHLIEQHLTGKLTSSEQKELHQLLSESAENRDIFCTQGLIHGRLSWEMQNSMSELIAIEKNQSQPFVKKWISVAALFIFALIAGSIIYSQLQETQPQFTNTETNETTSDLPVRTVARLTSEKEAHWLFEGDQRTLSSGFWFSPGEWSITSGAATITLDSGAKITAIAPASIELINSNHARLINGTVSVDVPEPAIGFTLDTPSGRVVDLSTRFSVSVEEGKSDEVHVIEGEVIVHYGNNHQQQHNNM